MFAIDPALLVDSFTKPLQQRDPALPLRDEGFSQAAAERQESSHEAQLEAQEDAEFQKAIAESLRDLPPSSPIATTSSLPNLQPMPPTATALTMGGLPVTQVTTSNRPMITTHMSKDWMRPYEDKSKQPQESPGKGQVDKEVIEKFRIVWWEKVCCFNSTLVFLLTHLQDDHDPIVFTIPDCPHWPKWKVTDSLSALERLGTDTLQFYDLEHKIWVEAPVSYPHTMTTDGYLLLRRPGVSCKDFDERLVIAMRRPVTSRVYMTKVRQSVKSKLLKNKGKKRASHQSEDSDGEVEFVESQCQLTHNLTVISLLSLSIDSERKTKEATQARNRPRLSPLVITGSLAGYPSSSPTSASTNPSFTFSTTPSRSQTPLTSASPSTPSPVATSFEFVSPTGAGPPPLMPGKSWPHNMYARDMVAGFQEMNRLKKLKFPGGFQARFEKVFRQKAPNRSTYHDQLKRWNLAEQPARDAATVAERNSAGHWSTFSKANPLKN